MLLLFPPAVVVSAQENKAQLEDFDQAFQFIKATYAWGERVEWDLLRTEFRPKAAAAATPAAFIRVLEELMDQLSDAHSHLGTNLADSWRLPPGDLAAEWRGNEAVVIAVKPGSRAAVAGLKPGMKVLGVQGQPLAQAILSRQSSFLKGMEDEDRYWTLNALLAGRHEAAMTFKVQDLSGKVLDLNLPAGPDREPALPETRLLPGDIGYIAFTEFESDAQVKRMDEALERFPQAKGWILDLRYNSGGDTQVMKPVIGRFLSRKVRYAFMRKRDGESLGTPWEEGLTPRGKVFDGPLAVLVSPWTQSVAEGAAMAVQGTLRGIAFGTRMAGLSAGVKSITLKHSGIRVQVSAEPVYDLFMRPRSDFRPKVLIDLANAKSEDPILDAAMAWIGTLSQKR
jgi:carboxyl-terminal processing protease